MLDEPMLESDDVDYRQIADEGDIGDVETGTRGEFNYVGRGLTPAEFLVYLNGGDGQEAYNFGAIAPDFIVLHHTGSPTFSSWTGGESGLGADAAKGKRRIKLDGIMRHYRDSLGWSVGPHLFIDDRYIWLFSEMRKIGIHAAWGNNHSVGGRLHASIGIEVVGDYTNSGWSEPVAKLVGFAVAALGQRLGTFELRYLYPTPDSKPGRKQTGTDSKGNPIWNVRFPERLRAGGITSHRDYNKPSCPGDAISEDFYLAVLRRGLAELQDTPVIDTSAVAVDDTQWSVAVTGAHTWKTATPALDVATEAIGRLEKGAALSFSKIRRGRDVQGNQWWGELADQVAFVSLSVVQPVQTFSPRPTDGRYVVVVDGAHIWEAPSTASRVALGGTATLANGAALEFDEFVAGVPINGNHWWGHLADGSGFVSLTTVEPAG